jgi:hypothetical protein
MSIEEMITDFGEGKIGHKEVLDRIDGYADGNEKLDFMLREGLVTPEDFKRRKLILAHPEILTARARQPRHSFLIEDVNRTLSLMNSKLRVHSRFEYPEYVNFRLPKNMQEIPVHNKLERYHFIFYTLEDFCKLLIYSFEYLYNATDLYFSEEFWIDDSRVTVIRNIDILLGRRED